MPAKTKVTKQMIIDAAFEIAREFGVENINARAVAKKTPMFYTTCYVSFCND